MVGISNTWVFLIKHHISKNHQLPKFCFKLKNSPKHLEVFMHIQAQIHVHRYGQHGCTVPTSQVDVDGAVRASQLQVDSPARCVGCTHGASSP